MIAMTYLNHAHTSGTGRSSAKLTTGATYIPRPASTGLCNTMTCCRCLQPRPLSALVADTRMRYQKRCAGGCATQGGPK